MAIYLDNLSPLSGVQNVVVESDIELSILDTAHNIVISSIKIWVAEAIAYDGTAGGFQTGFSGTIISSGSGFDLVITPSDILDHESTIEIAVEADNDNSDHTRLVYSFSTSLNLYYNIYFSTSSTHSWKRANSIPLLHDQTGNEYTISGLQGNVPYHISVVAGRMDNGEFIPLIDQPLGSESRGALDIFSVRNYPKYIIKTFVP